MSGKGGAPPGTGAGPAAATDERGMRLALQQGAAVRGRTGENPAVGCVILCGGQVVGAGGTQPPGEAHAEVVAIRRADEAGVDWGQCDLYVTLEPCAFHGRTPPCAELIVAKRPRRVVVALRDPHPRVNGAGLAAIRAAGIQVAEGVLAAEAARDLRSWLAQFGGPGEPAEGSASSNEQDG